MDKKILLIVGVVIIVIVIAALVRSFGKDSSATDSVIKGPYVEVGQHQYKVEIVTTVEAQAKGLGGRDSLAKGFGMLFIYPQPMRQAFWMKGMRFPIDIIWISGSVVTGIEQNVPVDPSIVPKIYNSPGVVDMVLELNAGTAAEEGLKVGDEVKVIY